MVGVFQSQRQNGGWEDTKMLRRSGNQCFCCCYNPYRGRLLVFVCLLATQLIGSKDTVDRTEEKKGDEEEKQKDKRTQITPQGPNR